MRVLICLLVTLLSACSPQSRDGDDGMDVIRTLVQRELSGWI